MEWQGCELGHELGEAEDGLLEGVLSELKAGGPVKVSQTPCPHGKMTPEGKL